MHVVGAGEAPDLLPGDIGPAQQRVPRQRAPAVAMRVDRQRGVARQREEAADAHGVEARHHAGAAELAHEVVPATHLVDLAGQVEGEHHLLSGALGMIVDDAHHRAGAGLERAGGAVGLQLVVLDEVDAGLAEGGDQGGGLPGIEADAGLDDGADQRPPLDAGKPPRAGDAEAHAGIGGGEARGQPQVEQAQAGELAQFEEIAGHGRDEIGQRRAEIVHRPGKGDGGAAEDRRRRAARGSGAGQGGRADRFQDIEPLDPCRGARLEFGGFAGHRHEGAARLLAGHRRGGVAGVERGLDQVIGFDAFRATHWTSFPSRRLPGATGMMSSSVSGVAQGDQAREGCSVSGVAASFIRAE